MVAKINLLSKSVSELIAAGEVVERPASAVKEIIENSIDAGALHITLEIKRGGISFIRVTDDGCGIENEDVPKAFLRHATSKISTAEDLYKIGTLGFRGEALASISSVARVELITKPQNREIGTHYVIEGGEERENSEIGCPAGTTVIIRDLFYNTPARMKFLKKDVTEGNAVAAIAERAALSHPEISFKFIRDEKVVFTTSGDKNTGNAVYSVLGRDFHSGLIEVDSLENGITVKGYTCKPVFCRASRSHQFSFLNGRLVISRTVVAAVEQAYKESSMVGKFPGFVLMITINPSLVDVNVHPAKTEVRFADEKSVFGAVFYAVKSALSRGDTRPEISPNKPKANNFFKMTAEQYRQTAVNLPRQSGEAPEVKTKLEITRLRQDNTPFFEREDVKKYVDINIAVEKEEQPPEKTVLPPQNAEEKPADSQNTEEYNPDTEVKFIGEAFNTYIIASRGGEIYIIDKHAAHERIIYNKLKSSVKPESQALLIPVTLNLSQQHHSALTADTDLLLRAGFEVEDFGGNSVIVRAIPASLDKKDIETVITEVAQSLIVSDRVQSDTFDGICHSVACKAAIKGGYITSKAELSELAIKVLNDDNLRYCPHGRPIAFLIKKSELEKYFGRIQ